MPSTYTHYRFGRDVLVTLPVQLQQQIESYRQLYDIGLHGPDILFYYHPLRTNPINQIGYQMHDEPAAQFFTQNATAWKYALNQDALESYLYGFVCHFILDSICHPYIEKMIYISKISHSEIETELDRFFMEKDNRDPKTYVPIQHIYPNKSNAKIITPCFSTLTVDNIQTALRGMIQTHHLLHAPHYPKRALLLNAMKLIGHYDSMHGLIMNPFPNASCHNYCLLLNRLYHDAIQSAADAILQYQRVLKDNASLPSYFQHTFGAGDNWKQKIISL